MVDPIKACLRAVIVFTFFLNFGVLHAEYNPKKVFTEKELDTFGEELGSDKYWKRRRASLSLYQSRGSAIPTLKKALESPSLEVYTRARQILRTHYVGADFELGEKALEVISESILKKQKELHPDDYEFEARRILSPFLESARYDRIELTKRRIALLGGKVYLGRKWIGQNIYRPEIKVRFKSTFGTISYLRELSRLPQIDKLSFHNSPLTDAHIQTLLELDSLEMIELYGTQVSKQGAEKIKEKFPNIEMRIGLGAALGLSISDWNKEVTVNYVTHAPTYEMHDIDYGYTLLELDGKKYESEREVEEYIATKFPGEEITLKLQVDLDYEGCGYGEEDDEPFEIKVNLPRWSDID